MDTDYVNFETRSDRAKYIATRFSKYIGKSLLDVGCDHAALRSFSGVEKYVGIDAAGSPDLKLDLEKIDHLPFENEAFDTVVCSDVLEHLDNLHHIFGELVRVTRKHLIVSLPNNWTNARRPIERGKGSIAHYGLPMSRPADRHKWFFGFSEAVNFLNAQQNLLPLSVVDVVANEKPRFPILRAIRKLLHPRGDAYRNRYSHTVWAIYQRN